MIFYSRITERFCVIDEFCKEYDQIVDKSLLSNPAKRQSRMSESEIMTIAVLFHLGGFRTFKHFYIYYVQQHMQEEFPETVFYNRFTEPMHRNLMPMTSFLKTCCLGDCIGISFVDSTPTNVLSEIRCSKGSPIQGRFYGFKLHIIINDKGEILTFTITQASEDDRTPLKQERFLDKIYGKFFADKGYVGKDLAKMLFID